MLIKILILSNVSEKKELQEIGLPGIDDIYFTHYKMEKATQERDVINDLIVDILLVLTNEQKSIDFMKEKKLIEPINKLKDLRTGVEI